MSEAALFPGYEPPDRPAESENLSAGQRLTRRQADLIAAGFHPLTKGSLHPLASRHRDAQSPKNDPYTCGSCYFRSSELWHNTRYPKCLFDPRRSADDSLDKYQRVAHSSATDVRAWWPACPDYSPSDRISNDAARSIPEDVS